MQKNIILAGVGGQGILSMAYVICNAALRKGLQFKQAEVHGMAQRGGDVQAHLRISDKTIHSDLIPRGKADIILGVEPLEVLRYVQFLAPDGVVIASTVPFINISDYPPQEQLLDQIASSGNHVLLDTDKLARHAGTHRAQNMVVLGACAPHLELDFADMEHHVASLFEAKGQRIVDMNLKAMRIGRAMSIFFTRCLGQGIESKAAVELSDRVDPDALLDKNADQIDSLIKAESDRAESIGPTPAS